MQNNNFKNNSVECNAEHKQLTIQDKDALKANKMSQIKVEDNGQTSN